MPGVGTTAAGERRDTWLGLGLGLGFGLGLGLGLVVVLGLGFGLGSGLGLGLGLGLGRASRDLALLGELAVQAVYGLAEGRIAPG
jgi:hypothetical protein